MKILLIMKLLLGVCSIFDYYCRKNMLIYYLMWVEEIFLKICVQKPLY